MKRRATALMTVLLLWGLGLSAPAWSLDSWDARATELFDMVGRHDDRTAAETLEEYWKADPHAETYAGAIAAVEEALEGRVDRARVLFSRETAANPADPSIQLAASILDLMQTNARTTRQALTTLVATFPESPSIYRRYAEVLELAGEIAPPMWHIPLALPNAAVRMADAGRPAVGPSAKPGKTPDSYEVKPVQGQAARERILRQLAQSQSKRGATPAPTTRTPPRPAKPVATRVAATPAPERIAATPAPVRATSEPTETPARTAVKPTPATPATAAPATTPAPRWTAAPNPRAAAKARALAAQKAQQDAQVRQLAQAEAKRKQDEERARLLAIAAQAKTAAEEQKKRYQAELAYQQAERKRQQLEADLARRAAEMAYHRQINDQKRQEAQQQLVQEQAERQRWSQAKEAVPPPPSATLLLPPDNPGPPPTKAGKAQIMIGTLPTNRRVWVGELRASVRARLGPPKQVIGRQEVDYVGLSIWFDEKGDRVSGYQNDTGYYYGPGGVRAGLKLREVIACLPRMDGLFHRKPQEPGATESIFVLSTLDGIMVECNPSEGVWYAMRVTALSPSGIVERYAELAREAPVKRLTPEFVFAMEERRRPLP